MGKESEKEAQLTKEQIIESLTIELGREKAMSLKLKTENEKNRITVESLMAENEELRKQVRQQVRESEKSDALEKEKEKKVNEEFLEMEKQLKKEKAIRKYVNELGMNEETATEATGAEVEKDIELWHEIIERHIKAVKSDARNEALQKFLADRPDIKAGHGDAETHSSSIDVALSRMNHDSGVNADVLSRYM